MPTKLVTSLAVIATGLAALEWWSVNELNGGGKFAGPFFGIAFVALMAAIPVLRNRVASSWHSAVVAALTAVIELIFGVAVVGSLSAIAVIFLPFSITSRFMQGDSATDFIIFLMLGLGLIVAARGWAKYSSQALLASKAQLDAERARALVAERDRELARAELTVLRAQIEPHFLWNTLAHVQYLTRKSPEDAEKMTGHLIRFLRSAVPQSHENAKLGSEIESARAYLELMKIRMGTRLSVTVEMEPSLSDIAFPPMMIQTLVENAIKHGLEPKVGQVTLSVTTSSEPNSNRLVVEVTDSGMGLQISPPTKGTGNGLKSIRERLKLLYGQEAELLITGSQNGGVIARIEIPY
jgi:sensor histidine kinase YesM